jgi:hypothetical protein
MGVPMAALAIGGGIVSAAGQLSAGQAAADRAAYQAQVYRNNAIIDQQNQNWAIAGGAAKEAGQGMRARAGFGNLIARQAASGVEVGTGSNKAVTDAASALDALDAMTTRSNTAREAYGYDVTKSNDLASAELKTREGEDAKNASYFSAASSLISGASSAFGKYAGWQAAAGGGSALSSAYDFGSGGSAAP